MDKLSKVRRSANMRAIRSKNTSPEMQVRRIVTKLGYRYRLHAKDLPGKPDLVFRARQKLVFVHGCFWHQHPLSRCLDARRPKSNTAYWQPKLDRNISRDAEHLSNLESTGWDILIIWDCETKAPVKLKKKIKRFLLK